MTTVIVSRIKTGSIKNVVAFGQVKDIPAPPYVVVKPESGPGDTRLFRIITHMLPGQNIFLEDYVFNDLDDLLSDYEATDRNGNLQHLYPTEEYTDIIPDNDDGTISMERVFEVPQRMY